MELACHVGLHSAASALAPRAVTRGLARDLRAGPLWAGRPRAGDVGRALRGGEGQPAARTARSEPALLRAIRRLRLAGRARRPGREHTLSRPSRKRVVGREDLGIFPGQHRRTVRQRGPRPAARILGRAQAGALGRPGDGEPVARTDVHSHHGVHPVHAVGILPKAELAAMLRVGRILGRTHDNPGPSPWAYRAWPGWRG